MTQVEADRAAVLRAMQAEVYEVNVAKGWAGPDTARITFGDAMALLHSEVSEALEAYRSHGLADATPPAAAATFGCSDPPTCHYHSHAGLPKPEGVGSEFADVLIRLLDCCERYGVDLAAEFERKLAFNRTREWRHGGRAL